MARTKNSILTQVTAPKAVLKTEIDPGVKEQLEKIQAELTQIDPSLTLDIPQIIEKTLRKTITQAKSEIEKIKREKELA